MEIIVTRSRIAGTLPHYAYRALVPADKVTAERRALTGTIVGPKHVGRLPCVRIAPLLAPDRYYAMPHAERAALASRIAALGRRIETLIIQASFPEMTEAFTPIVVQLTSDPGDASTWIDIDDLTAAFDRLEPRFADLTAFDLGLSQDAARCAA